MLKFQVEVFMAEPIFDTGEMLMPTCSIVTSKVSFELIRKISEPKLDRVVVKIVPCA